MLRFHSKYSLTPICICEMTHGESQDDPSGLNVCLYCFNGGCTTERDHARLHSQMLKHPLVLNIQRSRKKIKVSELLR